MLIQFLVLLARENGVKARVRTRVKEKAKGSEISLVTLQIPQQQKAFVICMSEMERVPMRIVLVPTCHRTR